MTTLSKLLHSWVLVSFVLAFVQAPFAHTHDSDPHHGHAQGLAHVHDVHEVSDSLTWSREDHDSDARDSSWFVEASKAHIALPALTPGAGSELELAVCWTVAPVPISGNHDPPHSRHLQPRAPPV